MELIQEADRPKWTARSNHSIKCFTKEDIETITHNYRTYLGGGGFGKVYKGVLEDETMVAVKKIIRNDVKEAFGKELIVHREINHKNVVRLIGYCAEENALVLVTEYIANGNLSDALHNDNRPIPLCVRLGIAIDCAEALAYIHSHMYTPVIHSDIKPGNILLDGNFHAKLSDFGISRLANTDKLPLSEKANTDGALHTSHPFGSIGYMDPLFKEDGLLSVKGDVYSFGVVLLELITRKKATIVVDSDTVYAFTNALARGIRGVRGMFDSEIASKDNMRLLEGVAKLAGECLEMESRDKRPEMIDVAERLRVLSKDSHQDPGWQPVHLFSWVRKSKPSPVTVPANILPPVLCRQFLLAEVKALTQTNNFGWLRTDESNSAATNIVATRVYEEDVYHSLIETMPKLHHDNLVPLIGYCHENEMKLLVFNRMDHGNLRGHLYGTQKPPLDWKQRIEICLGVARGLCYLHGKKLIHGKVNSSTIELNGEWVAKITYPYLGFSRTDADTLSTGTRMPSHLNEKSDVYSFGLVLLEVLCARPVFKQGVPEEQIWLVSWALRCKKKGRLDYIVDPYLKGKVSARCLNKFLRTALNCVDPNGSHRPSMEDVLSDLERL